MKDQTRNLNPTPEAVLAMNIWSRQYAEQGGGSMDFWDSLKQTNKDRCHTLLKKVLEAHKNHSL